MFTSQYASYLKQFYLIGMAIAYLYLLVHFGTIPLEHCRCNTRGDCSCITVHTQFYKNDAPWYTPFLYFLTTAVLGIPLSLFWPLFLKSAGIAMTLYTFGIVQLLNNDY